MSPRPTRPRRPGNKGLPRPEAAIPPTTPDAGQPPGRVRVDPTAPDPTSTPEAPAPARARRQQVGRKAAPSTTEGGGKGLRVLTLEARLGLAERIGRGIEAERAARTPEQEAAINRLLHAYEAENAKRSSVGQDPPRHEPPASARNTPGAGRATDLTEAKVWPEACLQRRSRPQRPPRGRDHQPGDKGDRGCV